MLYMLGFEEVGVAVGEVFFVDDQPTEGQAGAEKGVRLEIRAIDRLPLRGSEYSATPLLMGQPLWRVDLFESVPGGVRTRDRVHFHPRFDDWEPGDRHFDPALSADPLAWLNQQLGDLVALLTPGSASGATGARDALAVDRARPEILQTVERLWERVRAGELDPPGEWASDPAVRIGWL